MKPEEKAARSWADGQYIDYPAPQYSAKLVIYYNTQAFLAGVKWASVASHGSTRKWQKKEAKR
jgi:hypothetical protein